MNRLSTARVAVVLAAVSLCAGCSDGSSESSNQPPGNTTTTAVIVDGASLGSLLGNAEDRDNNGTPDGDQFFAELGGSCVSFDLGVSCDEMDSASLHTVFSDGYAAVPGSMVVYVGNANTQGVWTNQIDREGTRADVYVSDLARLLVARTIASLYATAETDVATCTGGVTCFPPPGG